LASTELFPTMTVGRFAAAMSRVDRSEFLQLYDPGVPLDPSTDGASQVLLVYANAKVTPTAMSNHNEIPELSTAEALENCDQMHVALLDHGTRKQCLALVPQYESFHLQNWMRLSKRTGELDASADFALVSRGHKSNGRNEFDPPDLTESRKHWKMLQQYFDSVDDVLAELKPILTKIAKRNTVIVMVVNFGQSELLINFVCAAKSRQLDLSNVIVFTTDQEATDLANGMGLATYFDQRVRNHIASLCCLAFYFTFCAGTKGKDKGSRTYTFTHPPSSLTHPITSQTNHRTLAIFRRTRRNGTATRVSSP
jgi:hypothetical protein